MSFMLTWDIGYFGLDPTTRGFGLVGGNKLIRVQRYAGGASRYGLGTARDVTSEGLEKDPFDPKSCSCIQAGRPNFFSALEMYVHVYCIYMYIYLYVHVYCIYTNIYTVYIRVSPRLTILVNMYTVYIRTSPKDKRDRRAARPRRKG